MDNPLVSILEKLESPEHKLNSIQNSFSGPAEIENKPLTDVQMETEGVELGALNSKLLQKIEELTLYLLMQDKRIELLKNENKQLKDLDSRIRILESQSN